MLAEARDDIKQADQKASVLLASLGVGFGAILGGQLAAGWSAASALSAAGQVVWWAGVVLAVSATASAAGAVWPRYRSTDWRVYGVAYWGHVASFSSVETLAAALESQPNDDVGRVTFQLFRISNVVRHKYVLVRLAIGLAAAAGLLLAVAALLLPVPPPQP